MKGTVFAVVRIADDAEFFNNSDPTFRGYTTLGTFATLHAAKAVKAEERGPVYVIEKIRRAA